jgi:integrase
MRSKRYQRGSIKTRCGKWVGQWRENSKRRNQVLGEIRKLSKSDARKALAAIIDASVPPDDAPKTFAHFVEHIYLPFYRRKWKTSTTEANTTRIAFHLSSVFGEREMKGFRRDELQELLDEKTANGLSFSTVDHLRWDMKQIFDMAVSEGVIARNPAQLLFTPREAPRPKRRAMTREDVNLLFLVLGNRERLIAKLAVIGGMRPGEIFGLTWADVQGGSIEVVRRVYRGKIDSPKTAQSVRSVALSQGVIAEVNEWRSLSPSTKPDAWVFPSENFKTPVAKDNCWRRFMQPVLAKVGLGWANFLVMRRTHSTLMRQLKVDPKLVADQLGHSVDVSLNVYTQSPVETRQAAVNELERSLPVM